MRLIEGLCAFRRGSMPAHLDQSLGESGPPNSTSIQRCWAALRATSAIVALVMCAAAPVRAWEATAPVELVVPAGTGGGADQMARFIQKLIAEHKLMSQPLMVVNKSGNSGAEGLLDMKVSRGKLRRRNQSQSFAVTRTRRFTLSPVQLWRRGSASSRQSALPRTNHTGKAASGG